MSSLLVNDSSATQGSVIVVSSSAAVRALLASLASQVGLSVVHDDATAPTSLAATLSHHRPLIAIVEVAYPAREAYELEALLEMRRAIGNSLDCVLVTVTTSDNDKLHQRVQQVGVEALFTLPLQAAAFRAALTWYARRAALARRIVGTSYAVGASDAVARIDQETGRPPSGSALAAVHAAQEVAAPRIARHAERVARHAFDLACAVGLSEDRAHGIAAGGLLHDIGHALGGDAGSGASPGAQAHGMRNPRNWLRSDVNAASRHVTVGLELLERARIAVPIEARLALAHHHERWTGGGYLMGLRGDVIPLAARIVAVADRFDRSRANLLGDTNDATATRLALAEVQDAAGTILDPDLVDAFVTSRRQVTLTPGEHGDMRRAGD